jgi:hypothetical protein
LVAFRDAGRRLAINHNKRINDSVRIGYLLEGISFKISS